MSKVSLHFSIGPVQEFVAQARKTRDFWVGSFLLSYLSGLAIIEVLEGNGEIVFPAVTDQGKIVDPLLKTIEALKKGVKIQKGPSIATLPNRFMAIVPEDFEPQRCADAVRSGWGKIAQAVWERFVKPIAHEGKDTENIWRRQVENFWEINWALGDEKEIDLLDRKKNWRRRILPPEPGDKCTLMGHFQELSGYLRIREREKQDAFWESLRKQVGGYELDERERLSAIGLIKRLFPLVARESIGWDPEQKNYPSTPYLSALPWIIKAVKNLPEIVRQYAECASSLPGATYKEDLELFPSLREIANRDTQTREFLSLNGNCFHQAALSNPNLWVQEGGEDPKDEREKCQKALKELTGKVGEKPSSFYALLLMDGDRMGALLRRYNAKKISSALNSFSKNVKDVVQLHNGVLVYAGGDDVLAMVSLEKALSLALKLREAYVNAFRETFGDDYKVLEEDGEGTISAALVYAHYNVPLTGVIKEAHDILDRVAKDETGRDSLAVTVWKGSGRVLTWSAPWEFIKTHNSNIFDEFLNALSKGDKPKEYNFAFFYNLRERIEPLFSQEGKLPEQWISEEHLVDLLAAEYRKNRERQVDWPTAREKAKNILKLCQRVKRKEKEDGKGYLMDVDKASFQTDGLMLVKFLSQKGVGV
ncbi:type III-B CRISPR-associated protein Cas10/Cmr2 [Caldanaerobacter subterraneus]|uniref:CRISPR-associated Cmr2 family protein n=2 Tax=Caldanaerobacter subterraneus TaxID=911092 RepID=A0A4R2JT50_9THEO|nr:type III-B CRISPR-associated protein Cas10/Cmr2 [Caldanaerobacter subterraneus]KKC28647.1 hydrolase [Caldanaerobacter subterraneus subsp. pacificus DSM 12653]MBE3579394.1 type III-B CRISPR-associated protein Cas10/Cmr2 [Caldanaerobacter subterraneus]TCO63531.1 CRISPR-associated Cmr2 family protein [Caldanaerobacter subterraneus]